MFLWLLKLLNFKSKIINARILFLSKLIHSVYFSTQVTEDTLEPFIFVHQTQWQRRLLHLYGTQICLLDATYKTSRFDLPLFFVCVNTNVGFSIVGSFLIANESRVSIKEGLKWLSDWNPDWHPNYFMTDYDVREISAVEETFPGNNLLK